MTNLFKSVIPATGVTVNSFIICLVSAIILGILYAFIHKYKSKSSQNFIVTLAILPAIVSIVILMVNGNVGTGIAVAGAFSLTRFRSQPGSAKEIGSIFMTMMIGLCCGTGFIGIGAVSTVVLSLVMIILVTLDFGAENNDTMVLTVVIPENLDYCEIFDDLFTEYTKSNELVKVRTCNMGSMYKLKYEVILKDASKQKKFIDDIRTRNGNLEVMLGRPEVNEEVI